MVTLNRVSQSLFGTKGLIIHDKKVLCHTLELPWRYNSQNQSCIPVGTYQAFKSNSPKFGKCFYLSSVPDRQGILIHVGNTLKDTRGCILVGLDTSDHDVLHSVNAMSRLYKQLPDEFTLTIKESL